VSRHRHSRFLLSFVLLLGAVFAGCTSLPPLPERAASTAMSDTTGTDLGLLAAASLEQAGPGESGFRLLPTGDFAFDARLALARRAERSLDAQYYQLANDSIGLQFLRELRDAARRGVRVRLLVDDLYTGSEDELFCSFAAIPNVEVRLFNPLPSRGGSPLRRIISSAHEFSRINLRMHNKLFIADNRFSVSGGRNLADEYFMRSTEANFIDMDVISAGPIVRELSQVFDRY
jgi:cardiolipin synthase C